MKNPDTNAEATEIHYAVIDRHTGERYSTTSSTSRTCTERARHGFALADAAAGGEVVLGIGRINPDGSIDDVTDDTEASS